MNRDGVGRFSLTNMSPLRVWRALWRRAADGPQTLMWHLSPFARSNRERILALHNLHIGERCFIVANGPSLRRTDLTLLSNEVTFGVNRIYLLFPESSFRPTYYVAVDDLVLRWYADEIRQLKMPRFLNWSRRSSYDAQHPPTYFLKSKMVLSDSFQGDVTKPLVTGGTVTFSALQIAYYLGFRTVVLVGLDHYYPDPQNIHFRQDYHPPGRPWRPDLIRSEIDYALARNAFESDGREIFDATVGGHCPIFKKADYMSLFN